MLTETGMSICGSVLNATVQVREMLFPTDRIGLSGSLVTSTDLGAGTKWTEHECSVIVFTYFD